MSRRIRSEGGWEMGEYEDGDKGANENISPKHAPYLANRNPKSPTNKKSPANKRSPSYKRSKSRRRHHRPKRTSIGRAATEKNIWFPQENAKKENSPTAQQRSRIRSQSLPAIRTPPRSTSPPMNQNPASPAIAAKAALSTKTMADPMWRKMTMQDQFGHEQSYMWHPITRETLILDSPGGEKTLRPPQMSVNPSASLTGTREFSGLKSYTRDRSADEREDMLAVYMDRLEKRRYQSPSVLRHFNAHDALTRRERVLDDPNGEIAFHQ